jgi:hypothetical protein
MDLPPVDEDGYFIDEPLQRTEAVGHIPLLTTAEKQALKNAASKGSNGGFRRRRRSVRRRSARRSTRRRSTSRRF